MIVILSSEPGCGKTYQCMGFEEPILYFDMENRAKKTMEKYYNESIISLHQCMKYNDTFQEDHISTLTYFQSELKKLGSENTIVIDGISDLRDYCHTKWCKDNKRKRAMNPGDWEQINDMVRELLFPLINYCRVKDINLIMTSQFKDDYALDSEGKSSKIGRIPALKEWMSYNVDTLITLTYQKPKYRAICTKSIAGCWEQDITDLNLYSELLKRGV